MEDELGLPPSDPEAFVFPNRDGSFMDPSNYRKRVLHKLATESRPAEAYVPGHPAHGCDIGSEERDSEGRAGCHAAFARGDDY